MNRLIKLFLLPNLLFFCCLMLQAKETKVKITETVLYVGNAEKKVPAGTGVLYVMDRPSKEPVLRQDVISGSFNGNSVSSASVIFSSGWEFKGSLIYSAEIQSKKPLLSIFKYNLTGVLSDPSGTHNYMVDNLEIERITNGDQGSLETESMVFSSGSYVVRLEIDNDSWCATPFIKIAPAIYYEGNDNKGTPLGYGTLSIFDSDDVLLGHPLDRVSGYFSNNNIDNAVMDFSSGWHFKGTICYKFSEDKIRRPYGVDIVYIMNGMLIGSNGETFSIDDGEINMLLKQGSIYLHPYSWNQYVSVPHNVVSKYDELVRYEMVTTPVISELKEDRNKQWGVTNKRATEHPEYHYKSGHIITEYSDGYSIQYPNTDFVEVKNGQINNLLKTFPGCAVHFDENQSNIFYSDGGRYVGSFDVNSIQYHSAFASKKTELLQLMNPDLFVDEIPLMYIDGVYTYPNGKTEKWEKGITDYQQNEINGNYEKVSAAIKKAQQEKLASEAAELRNKWQLALPALRKEYGAKNVDAIYNYRLNRRTPLELFKELARLGLIELLGPMYSTNAKNSCHEYVIAMRNWDSGELQYSLILKFVHPFWSSPDWILDRYSTNF